MKIVLFAGLVLVVLGIASLLMPIPHTETAGVNVGNTNLGLQTSHSAREWLSSSSSRFVHL